MDWADLVERSSYPFERLDTARFTAVEDRGLAQLRLDRWAESLRIAGRSALSKRLAWDGLSQDDGLRAVGPVRLRDPSHLPPWVDTLRRITERARAAAPQPASALVGGPSSGDPPYPFEEIWRAPVAVAREALDRRLDGMLTTKSADDALMRESALRDLERDLGRRLAHLAGRTMLERFDLVRPFGLRKAARFAPTDASFGRVHYDAFVAGELASGLLGLFGDHPVLARLVAATVDDWVESSAELAERLLADRAELARTFGVPSLGVLVAADSLRSDPHERGRTVVMLRFESGLRVVYKPRPIAIAGAFARLVDWCRTAGAPVVPPALEVLPRSGYGWAAHVEQTPCTSPTEATRYFERAGALLALLHLVETTDCHHENLIATGEGLVLIDAETLLHPEPVTFAEEWGLVPDAALRARLQRSVLRTGLLPRWEFSKDRGVAQDISGLGSGAGTLMSRVPVWRHIATDGMALVDEDRPVPMEKNVAWLDGQVLHAASRFPELSRGFEAMHRFCIEHRGGLARGPLLGFAEQVNRFVFRGTRIYTTLLQDALRPEHLRDGADLWIRLERLGKAYLTSDERPSAWPLYREELEAMARANVPLFRASTSSTSLLLESGAPVEGFFTARSYDRVLDKLARLDDEDLALQRELLQGALVAVDARSAEPPDQHRTRSVARAITGDECVARATAIGDDLLARALVGSDGSLSWLGLSFEPLANRYQMELGGDHLYDGRAGVAVFFAALYETTRERRFRGGALAALAGVRRGLEGLDGEGWRRALAFGARGAALGPSSIAYALLRTGKMIDAPELHALCLRIASALPVPAAPAEDTLDVLSGSAGALLVLLRVHAELGDPAALEKARRFGELLLAARRSEGGAPRAWSREGMPQLAGLSHGAAGVALALARLFSATGEPAFRDAAIEGLAFERTLYLADEKNWVDRRPDFVANGGPRAVSVQWCNGAPGIALARIALREHLSSDGVDHDIERGIETTEAYGLGGPDHLCCGNMGRVETLWRAGSALERPALRDTALRFAAWVVDRATGAGSYRIFANAPPGVTSAGLFTGVAGIGYQLLRLARPELPSVLLFE